jgi:hypothetical protein
MEEIYYKILPNSVIVKLDKDNNDRNEQWSL